MFYDLSELAFIIIKVFERRHQAKIVVWWLFYALIIVTKICEKDKGIMFAWEYYQNQAFLL